MGSHIIDGQFQSDKYPACPRGKVPLSVRDATAQDLLWEYAQRRRAVDAEFSADLESALVAAGYAPGRAPTDLPGTREGRLAMIFVGRRHDETMTRVPWDYDNRKSVMGDTAHEDGPVEIASMGGESLTGDDVGIPWMRNNLRAMLDLCEEALAQVDRLSADLARANREVAILRVLYELAWGCADKALAELAGDDVRGEGGGMDSDDAAANRAALLRVSGIDYDLRIDSSGRRQIAVVDAAKASGVEGTRLTDGVAGPPASDECLIGDSTAEIARLHALLTTCAHCGQEPASCIGIYDGRPGDVPQSACDRCCGHGNEDGWCVAIHAFDLSDWASRRDAGTVDQIADWLEHGSSRGAIPDSAAAIAVARAIRSGAWKV